MLKRARFVIAPIFAIFAIAGCKQAGEPKPAPSSATAPAQSASRPAAAAAPRAPAPTGNGPVTGVVVETMNSGGYTYVNVKTGGGEHVWGAAPQVQVKVGDTASFGRGAPMQGYRSKTLNRTFDLVYFASTIKVGGAGAAPAQAPASRPSSASSRPSSASSQPSSASSRPATTGAPAVPKVEVGKIQKASGGHTVAEVYAGKATLAGKQVHVRGKVVKYNADIMGMNWLHLQDGSGSAGTDDLTITTKSVVKVGDIVRIEGLLVTDKDFGAGYKYPVIVESAKITVE